MSFLDVPGAVEDQASAAASFPASGIRAPFPPAFPSTRRHPMIYAYIDLEDILFSAFYSDSEKVNP
jgi:hypothetical protein